MNRRLLCSALAHFFIQLLTAILATHVSAGSATESPRNNEPMRAAVQSRQGVVPLKVDEPVERDMRGGETHTYRVTLAAGQFMRVVVDQRGIDVVVALFGTDGEKIIEVDSPNGTRGPEPVSAVAEISGAYRLEVRSLEKDVPAGRYEAKLEELRVATGPDKSLVAALRVFAEAESLRVQGTAESLQASVGKYVEALPLYRAAGDRRGEAGALNSLGGTHYSLGKAQEALDSFVRAFTLYRGVGDNEGEATTLNNAGKLYEELGDKQKALESYTAALTLYRVLKDRHGEAAMLSNVGALHVSSGRAGEGLDSLSRALLLYREVGDSVGEATTLNSMAAIHADLGEKQKAIDEYAAALLSYRAARNLKGEAAALNNIAAVYDELGEKQKALDVLAQLLPIRRALKDRRSEARTLSDIGKLYDELGGKREALEKYAAARAIHRQLGDQDGEATVLNRTGMVYDSLGEREAALDNYAQALTLRRTLKDRRGEAETLNNIGVVYGSLGKRAEALEKFAMALLLYREVGDRKGEATTHNNIGNIYSSQRKTREALASFAQALPLTRAAGYRLGEAATLNNIGKVHDDLGEKQKALDYYAQALPLLIAAGYRRHEAATLNNIGKVHADMGDKQKALGFYFKALEPLRDAGDRVGQAATLNNIGIVYDSLRDKQKALDYYEQALPLLLATGDGRGVATTLTHIGGVYDDVGRKREALEKYAAALAAYRQFGDPNGEALVLNNTGNIQDDLGEKQKALDSFAQALILARTVGNRRGEAATLNNIGAVYYSKGERRKALTYYLQALPLRRAVGDTGGEAVTLSNIGKVYDDSGEQRKALGWYERAVSVFESIRSVTTIEEIKTGLAEEAALAYERTALLLARMGQTARAFDIIERARARAFLDQLGNIRPNVRKGADAYLLREEQDMGSKIAALEVRLGQELAKTSPDAGEVSLLRGELAAAQRRLEVLFTRLKLTDPEYAALRSVETLRLAEVQKLLNRDTTLLSYFVTPEKTLAFVITRSSFHYVELPVKEAELRVAVSSFRDFASLNELRPGSLAQLSDWLIVPLKQHIKTPLLGVVPYGVLHYLPFAALTDGSGYLSEQYSLFHLPSASVLMFVKGNLPGTRLLALAQSRAEGLTVLGYADEEVETVARIYDTKGFPTGRMSKTDFLKRAGDYDIIHIAAHAELNPSNPLFSRILLMPDGKGGEGGDRLEVREIYNLDLSRTGLVVLSACETQLGPYSEGDDIIGLTRAFAYAGTPSVVASLWAVDDESTSRLMEAFYASLKRGASKAAALRMAQAEVRKKYPHPYYWAGFVLNGDPGGRAVL